MGSFAEENAQCLEAMTALRLGVPVAGFFAAHLGDASCYGLQAVQALEWLDCPEEKLGVCAKR